MVTWALKPLGHLAAWLLWHTSRISVLEDLDSPRPPASE
jgi:hypothetical protein